MFLGSRCNPCFVAISPRVVQVFRRRDLAMPPPFFARPHTLFAKVCHLLPFPREQLKKPGYVTREGNKVLSFRDFFFLIVAEAFGRLCFER